MPPKRPSLTEEQKAAKNLKLRKKRVAETPEVREKTLQYNQEQKKAIKQRLDPAESQEALEAQNNRRRDTRKIQTSKQAIVTRTTHRLWHQNVRDNETMSLAEERSEVNRQQMTNYRRIENDFIYATIS